MTKTAPATATYLAAANNPNFHRTIFIIDRYDNRYVSIFLNGIEVDSTHKRTFEGPILSRKNRAAWVKAAGVASENDLLFTYYGFHDQFYSDDDWDGDLYGEWANVDAKLIASPFEPDFHEVDLEYIEDNYAE